MQKIETEVAISSALFADPAEQELHDVLIRLNKELIPDIVTYNYAGALKLAEQVVEPVNKFFDSVMVMDENVDIKIIVWPFLSRRKRLQMLSAI